MRVIEGILMWCFVVLCYESRLTDASESFKVSSSTGVIRARYGSSVVLPCWLTPQLDAESMEIRWYRPEKYQTPVLFYQNRKLNYDVQEDIYRNRSSLTSRDAQSTGLKQGDISLQLENLNFQDNGIFHCYISGDRSYDSSTVNLLVTALGSPPLISLQDLNNNAVNVTCSSCGWFPKPQLLWQTKDADAPLPPGSLVYREEMNRQFCIESWIIYTSTDLISCSISLSEEEKRDVRLDVGALVLSSDYKYRVLVSMFAVAFLITAVMLGVALFYYKKYKTEYILIRNDEEEGILEMDDLRKGTLHITLDQNKVHENVVLHNDMIRDEDPEKITSTGFPYELCVSGKDPIKEGRAYWEVGLAAPNIPVKKSWLIGVAKASYELGNDPKHFTVLNGFWFLRSDPQNGLSVNTTPKTFLPVKAPESVGVLLDYDKGELSFYNAKENVRLCTIKTDFPKNGVVPLFNPGRGDKAPLKINCNLAENMRGEH
ncbi:butyrophilin subfamily 1 member A1-like [Trichomycterus rosablanca]|uniref:butyrophilin subfamily 1 member A1-like n=1 Tax=Trichomycterus rosablanca TaxID=2290929 RepID=UPI002F35BADE